MNLLEQIQRARKGEVITIPFNPKRLSRFIFLAKGIYHYISGAGGSGKSAWVDLHYVINPTLWFKYHCEVEGLDLRITLRSMERSKERRKAKWVCMKLFLDHGILIDTASLLGWGLKKSKVTDDIYEKVVEAYDWVESLLDVVTIIDGIENPTGIHKQVERDMLQLGTLYKYIEVEKEHILIKQRRGESTRVHPNECPKATVYQPVYVPDNPKLIYLEITDHIQAMKKERGYDDKRNFDKFSEYCRIQRDLYGVSPIVVNQLNRNIGDTYRRVKTELLPEDGDLAGSSNMFNDCDMAAVLFNPYKYNLTKLKGWEMEKFKSKHNINRFRSFHLLKNTYGVDNQIIGYNFIGENGLFRELPGPKHLTEERMMEAANPKCNKLITRYLD